MLSHDMRPGGDVACELMEQAASQDAAVVCFSELFLTPFFPNQLTPDYEEFFLELPSPVTDPLFRLARDRRIAMIFPYGERAGRFFYNSALVVDADGRHLGTYRPGLGSRQDPVYQTGSPSVRPVRQEHARSDRPGVQDSENGRLTA